MSLKMMDLVFSRPEPSNSAERLVLLTLADYANEHRICWPSVRTLSERTRLSTRGVQKAIRKLEVAGLLRIRTGGINATTGDRYANTYTLVDEQCSPTPEQCSPTPEQVSPMNNETPPPEHRSGGWVNNETPPPEHRSSHPSYNPHKQPSEKGSPPAQAKPIDLNEVEAYADTLSLPGSEAAKFFDHFTANGWRQAGGNAIKDWQAALRNWGRRVPGFGKKRGEGGAGAAAPIPFNSNAPNAHFGGYTVFATIGDEPEQPQETST